MRKFTLLALSATIAVSGMAQNQEKSAMNLQKAKQIAAKVMARQATAGIVAPKAVVKMPKSINQYGYDNGAWTLEAQNTYRYDSNGSLGMEERTAADKSVKVRNVYAYDSKETAFCTKHTQQVFSPATSKTPTENVMLSIDVKRDNKGRLVDMTKYEFSEAENKLKQTFHTTFEYGTTDMPVKITRVDIYMNSDNVEEAQTTVFSNIEWADGFNGDLLSSYGSTNEDMILDKANRIKNADLNISISTETNSLDGTLTGTYLDNKSILDFSIIYGSVVIMQQIYNDEYLDENGSHRLSLTYNQMNSDLSGFDTQIMDYTMLLNEHHEELEETLRTGTSSADMEIMSSSKYENSYNAETGLRDYAIISEYDTKTKQYSPTTKLEVTKYIDVTTVDGINGVEENSADAVNGVYNAQGMFMGKDINSLDKGLYIVKMNGKTVKIQK